MSALQRDLRLTDGGLLRIVMPEMSGIDLAIAIRRDVPTCKVLLFSGHVDALELIQQARASGYEFALVQKPIHPTKLVEAIQNL